MICGKEIKEDKYCEIVFESGHKLESHRRCAVEFTIQMREALEKEGVLEEMCPTVGSERLERVENDIKHLGLNKKS